MTLQTNSMAGKNGQAVAGARAAAAASCLKAQAATEMLVMVAFALVFVLPMVFLFMSATGNELSKTSVAQAKISARTIADEAGDIYLQGEHARKSVVVNYPSGVMNATIEGGLVIISLEQDGRRMDIVSSTFANVSGNLGGKRTAGLQKINFEYMAEGNYVNITYG